MGTSTQEMYTVLLYGETGVGKSTFINACYNYLKFPTLDSALNAQEICCRIPIKYSWQNADFEDVIVQHGSHVNENLDGVGVSATQNLNKYYYSYQNNIYRFVDTPGFNDSRGYEVELENVKKTLDTFKNGISEIHALCILLRPDENRETLRFKYGMMQFLSLFHRNLCRNIIFLYTHSKGCDYRQNTTGSMVRNIIGEIENNFHDISIPYGPSNVFMLDNDGFRYLLAVKLDMDSADDVDTYRRDWSKSSEACRQLLEYIQTLDCRSTHDTLQLNASKLKLEDLYFKETLKLEEKLKGLEKKFADYQSKIQRSEQYIDRLKGSLYVIAVTVREGPYHMICTNTHCEKRDIYSSDGQACCPSCVSWAKMFCDAFMYDSQKKEKVCKYCGCSIDNHDYLNKVGFREKVKRKNEVVEDMIMKEKISLSDSYNSRNMCSEAITELQSYIRTMEKKIAGEVIFIKNNAIVSYHEECINHIKMEIDKSKGEKKNRLEEYLQRYQKLYEKFIKIRVRLCNK